MANPELIDGYDKNDTNTQPVPDFLKNDGYADGQTVEASEHNELFKQLFAAANKNKNDGVWDWEDPTALDATAEYNEGSLIRHNGEFFISLTDLNEIEPVNDGINWKRIITQDVLDEATQSVTNVIESNGSAVRVSSDITVTVGSGGQYTTINEALEYLSTLYPLYKNTGVTATISLLTGFVMAEQVLVRGLDFGWVTITGVDAETTITHTALTTAFEGRYPAFGVNKGGTLPYINALFNMNYGAGVGNTAENKDGIYAHGAGSSANIGNAKGVINAGSCGIHATNSALINGYMTASSGAGYYGVAASFNAEVTVYALNADACGVCGVNAAQGGKINCNSAKIRNQTTGINCIRVQDGSTIEASSIDITGSTVTVLSQAANAPTGNGIIYQ
jgi:hypothetical protein